MTRRSVLTIGLLVGCLSAAAPAQAQSVIRTDWTHGTTLDVFGGGATATSANTRGAMGAGFGWELNHWVEVEGNGMWLAASQGDQAFAAELRGPQRIRRSRIRHSCSRRASTFSRARTSPFGRM